MIKYQRIEGVISSANARQFTPTPEGIAMGSVPGWRMLLDPSHATSSVARNRVFRDKFAEAINGNSIHLDKFPGSLQPAFLVAGADYTRLNPALAAPPGNWSIVVVASPTSKAGTGERGGIVIANNHSDSEVSLNFAFRPPGTSVSIYRSGTLADLDTRLTYAPTRSFVDRTTLLIATFSTRDGLSIFENGVLGAHSATDKRPLTHQTGAGEWNVLRGFKGHAGMIGMLDVDLSWPENTRFRRAIESFMMNKYGIVA